MVDKKVGGFWILNNEPPVKPGAKYKWIGAPYGINLAGMTKRQTPPTGGGAKREKTKEQ
jgi:hypothetical protein